jgi:aminopeptidase N
VIARALGDFVHDAAAGAALAQVVERGDASYFVEAEAALSLGKTRTPRAGELLRIAATRESYTDIVRSFAYRGLAEARDDSALGLLVEGLRWGRVTQGRRAAAMALAILMRGRRDREARDVRERIELLLGDRDFRVQAAAVEALALIGEAAAVGALRRMIDRELDGRLRRRGKEVVRDLENNAGAGEDLRRMRDELGELRSLTGTLRERIELLEARTHGDDRSASKADPAKKTKADKSKSKKSKSKKR